MIRRFSVLLLIMLCAAGVRSYGQETPVVTQLVVFGDSLSDTGNVWDRTRVSTGGTVAYPSEEFNYSDGRFTNSGNTSPSSQTYNGVWHEQLAHDFLHIAPPTHSLAGGMNFGFGAATTEDGSRQLSIVSTQFGNLVITIDDMGKQVDDYLASNPSVDPNALYVVWGGVNDIIHDDSSANVSAAAGRIADLVSRLAVAGAQRIMVPNLPPLGTIPSSSDPGRIQAWNTASSSFRKQLNLDLTTTLSFLAPQGITPTVYRVDLWKNMIRLLCDPENDGFIDTTTESQGDSGANPDQFLFWDGVHPTTAGHHWTAKEAYQTLSVQSVAPAKTIEISTRVFVDSGERASIAGFIVTGAFPKRVLLRGLGRSLLGSGVPNPLSDPTLILYGELGNRIADNDNWRDTQESEIISTGIPPPNDFESAIVTLLSPGSYTVVLAGKNNTSGIGLIEVYDLEPISNATLANLSTRGFVGTDNNAMIGGVIIGAGDDPLMVFRAIGPSLANAGVTNPLLDPILALYDGNGALISLNDDWRDNQLQAIQATELAPTNDRESTIVAFLHPGNYTAVVRGNGTGVALVESYRVP